MCKQWDPENFGGFWTRKDILGGDKPANYVEISAEERARVERENTDRQLRRIGGTLQAGTRGFSLERATNLDETREFASKFILTKVQEALDLLNKYDSSRMDISRIFENSGAGKGHWGDWVAIFSNKKTVSQMKKELEKILKQAQQLQNCTNAADFDAQFSAITNLTYKPVEVRRAMQALDNPDTKPEDLEFTMKMAFGGDISGNTSANILQNGIDGRNFGIGSAIAIVIALAGALGTALAPAGGTAAVAGGTGTAAGGTAAATGTSATLGKAALAGAGAVAAGCGPLAQPEAEPAGAQATLEVNNALFVNYMAEQLAGKRFDSKDGVSGQIYTKGSGDNVKLVFGLGSQELNLNMCSCLVNMDGQNYICYSAKCSQTGVDNILKYINDCIANGMPVPENVDGKTYTFGKTTINNKEVPTIVFDYIDDNGKAQKLVIPIYDNSEISDADILTYMKNVVGMEGIPKDANLTVGTNEDGVRGVTAEWEVPVDMTTAEIEDAFRNSDEWKNILAEHPDATCKYNKETGAVDVTYNVTQDKLESEIKEDFEASKTWKDIKAKHPDAKYTYANGQVTVTYNVQETITDPGEIVRLFREEHADRIPEGAKVEYKNGKIYVTYDVTTTEPKSKAEILADFKAAHPDIPADAISYKDGDSFVTVTYPGEKYSQEHMEAEFRAAHPEVPANATLTIDEKTGDVVAKWNLTDIEVVTKLNQDPNSAAEYSIDANGNVVETFTTPDGNKYTHVNGANMKLNDSARAAFKPFTDFLGLGDGVILEYKTNNQSSDIHNYKGLNIELTSNDIDKAEYRITIDGVTTTGVPKNIGGGKIQVGNATFWYDEEEQEYRLDIKDGSGQVHEHSMFQDTNGLSICDLGKGGTYVHYDYSGHTHVFNTPKADYDYNHYPREQKVTGKVATQGDPTTKTFNVETEKEVTKPETKTYDDMTTTKTVTKTEGPFNVDTTKVVSTTEPHQVTGVKTETQKKFFAEHLTKNRDDAKEFYDLRRDAFIEAYQKAVEAINFKFVLIAEAQAEATAGPLTRAGGPDVNDILHNLDDNPQLRDELINQLQKQIEENPALKATLEPMLKALKERYK